MKKIAIVGVGGRTGTMFAFELKNSADVLGIGRKKEVKLIKEKKLYIERKGEEPKVFEVKVIEDIEFKKEEKPDIIFLTTKNPVSSPIKFYYQKIKEKLPSLLISQNGIAALEDSKKALKETFDNEAEKVRIVRIALFNPIDRRGRDDRVYVKYSLPIRIALSKGSGPEDIKDIVEIFKDAGFELTEVPEKEAKNLEFSKLFLNLIGMASASQGLSIKEGFKRKDVFIEEIKSLREYKKVVEVAGGKFLNFPHYPVKSLATFFSLVPLSVLFLFRNVLAKLITKGREGKRKDLDEIEFYNGAVVKLGEKLNVETPINKKIIKRVLKI